MKKEKFELEEREEGMKRKKKKDKIHFSWYHF